MPIFRRGSKQPLEIPADGVLWGVARHDAASDRDDPKLHAEETQHAYLLGVDDQAVCGFRPPMRAGFIGSAKFPQLALPVPENPRCPKCTRLLAMSATPGSGDEPVAVSNPGGAGGPEEQAAGDLATDPYDEPEPLYPEESPPAEGDMGARDSAWAPRRSSARRGGQATVPTGRRSVIVQLPEKLIGSTIAAEIDGDKGAVRVRSVSVNDDGTIRITLNQNAEAPVAVSWYVVSGPQRS